ncbi:MAG: MEDS domain-containing protein [Terriglobales bacterium]
MSTVHSVQFYDTHQALIDRLCGVVSSALLVGNSVLIVATKDHRELLTKSLQRLEVNVRKYAREERFTMCDADEMLSKFMVKDMPDPEMFRSSVGQLILDVKKAARSKDLGLTVFGEMVAVLWDRGYKAGALALESLWNDLLNEKVFHLHCAYPRSLFSQDEPGMLNVCESHTHVAGLLTPAFVN